MGTWVVSTKPTFAGGPKGPRLVPAGEPFELPDGYKLNRWQKLVKDDAVATPEGEATLERKARRRKGGEPETYGEMAKADAALAGHRQDA